MASRAVGVAVFLLLSPRVAAAETVQERLASAVAAHHYAEVRRAAEELRGLPGYAAAANAAGDFATLAMTGASAAQACASGDAQTATPVYLTELSRLLERALRFDEAASCLVRAAAVEPGSSRREAAVAALLRAGRDAEASKLLAADSDTQRVTEIAGLAARPVVSSERWPELRWSATGGDAAAFGETVVTAYAAFAAATGSRLVEGLTVERLEETLRARTRLAGMASDGVAGVTLGRLVSVTEGLPAALEREVVWHEMAHAFLVPLAPYGGPGWLGEAVAFTWSRALMQSAGVTPAGGSEESGWSGWIPELEQSDQATLDAATRMARDAFAAELGAWFARRYGMAALLSVYAATAHGEAASAAFARVAGSSGDGLRAAFAEDRRALSRPKGRTGP